MERLVIKNEYGKTIPDKDKLLSAEETLHVVAGYGLQLFSVSRRFLDKLYNFEELEESVGKTLSSYVAETKIDKEVLDIIKEKQISVKKNLFSGDFSNYEKQWTEEFGEKLTEEEFNKIKFWILK